MCGAMDVLLGALLGGGGGVGVDGYGCDVERGWEERSQVVRGCVLSGSVPSGLETLWVPRV